jgi:polar amino acid transport system substrate-binding protein
MNVVNRIIISLLFFSTIIFSNELKSINVQLNWKHQFEHAGFYAAIEKGFYKDVGLKVNLFEKKEGSSSFDEVMNDNADFAIGYSSLVLEYASGKPVVALASLFQHSPLVFLSKQSSNIRTISDMVGRKVMINPKSKSSASLSMMIKKEGVSYDDMILLNHSYNTNDLIDGTTEVMASYISNQPFALIKKDITFNIIDPVNYGYDFYENILFTHKKTIKNNPTLVNKFLTATLKGWSYALKNENEIIKVILDKYSKRKSKEALEYESNIIKSSLIPKNIPIGNIDKKRFERIISLYEELGLSVYSNVNIDNFIYKRGGEIDLSLAEKEWIREHSQIYFTGDPNWLPYEAFVEGKYVGVVNEHLKLLEQYTGLTFVKVPTTTWSQSLEFSQKKYVDILSETTSSLLKDKLTFTKSYLSSPVVMLMEKDEDYKNSINDILKKKIAVIKDYGYVSEIQSAYPKLNYHEVDNIQDGLLSIENGEADVLLCALPQASYWINKYSLQNVRIVGKTRFSASLAFGVRSDYKILVGILNKAIDKIPQTKQQEILTNWTKVKYNQKIDYTSLWIVLTVTTSIIGLLVFRHKALRKHNKELTYLSEIDYLTKIYNRGKLNSLLEEQLQLFNRYETSFGLIIIDIDYFKEVNDIYGHNIGDSVLVEFSLILKHNIRDVDYVGRWGGEEFLVICPRLNKEEIVQVAKKLHSVIRRHEFEKIGYKTASFGVTICKNKISKKELIKNADKALYYVKENGRDDVKYN